MSLLAFYLIALTASAAEGDDYLDSALAMREAGLAADEIAAVRADARAAFDAAGLDAEMGDRAALGALLVTLAHPAGKLSPDVLQRVGGSIGVARLLTRETKAFGTSDLGGGLMIVAVDDPSAPERYARRELSWRDITLRSQQVLAGSSQVERTTTLMRARAAASSVPPPVLVATAIRFIEDQAASTLGERNLTGDQLVAYLVMHRGTRDDEARVLAWASVTCAPGLVLSLLDEWAVDSGYAQARLQATADDAQQRRQVMTAVRPWMPLVGTVVFVLAAAVVVAAWRRTRGVGAPHGLFGAWACGAMIVVVATGLCWKAVTDGVAGDDRAFTSVPIVAGLMAALGLVAGLVGGARGSSTGAMACAGCDAGAARTVRTAMSFGMLAFPIAIFVIPVAAAVMAGGDIAWLGNSLLGRRPSRRGWWRRVLVVPAWVLMWQVVNPLGVEPGTDAAILPVLVLAAVFIPASVVSDIVSMIRWLQRRRAVPASAASLAASAPKSHGMVQADD